MQRTSLGESQLLYPVIDESRADDSLDAMIISFQSSRKSLTGSKWCYSEICS
jgi:hypothetical protein